MSLLDIIILFVILIFTISSYKVGFVEEMLALVSIVISLVIAYIFAPILSPHLKFLAANIYLTKIIAGIIIFSVIYLFFKLVRDGMFDFIEDSHLSSLDRTLGLILGFVKGVIFAGIIVLTIYQINIQPIQNIVNQSVVCNFFMKTMQNNLPFLKGTII